jgi:hypothetical protein
MEQQLEDSDWTNRTRQQRLELLAADAEQLAAIAKSAFASRDQARPLVSVRDELTQQLSKVNGRIQEIPDSHENIELAKLCRASEEIPLQRTQLTEQIARCYGPFVQFESSIRAFLGRLRSTLMFGKSARAKKRRADIESLPLLKWGSVGDWTAAVDNLEAIRLYLEDLREFEYPSANAAKSTEMPAGRLSERDRAIRDQVTVDRIRNLSNPEIMRTHFKQLKKLKEFTFLTENALRSALNRIRRAEHLPSSLDTRKKGQ